MSPRWIAGVPHGGEVDALIGLFADGKGDETLIRELVAAIKAEHTRTMAAAFLQDMGEDCPVCHANRRRNAWVPQVDQHLHLGDVE